MKVLGLGAAALTLVSPALAEPPGFEGQPFAQSRSFWRTGGKPRPVWFVCAPVDGADMTVVGLPDSRRQVSIPQPLGPSSPDVYKLGQADPGAGQVFWPLSTPDGKEVGNIHAFNPGALGDPKAATTPTFTSIRLSGAQWNCRWLERTRLMGFSTKRTVAVTQAPDGALEYRTFDFSDAGKLKRIDAGAEQTTTASLDVKGGEAIPSGFAFRSGAYAYRITIDLPGARITVRKDGHVIAAEPLVAWTVSGAP